MEKAQSSKQVKFICPEGCKTVRFLNKQVNLALCDKCQTMMVLEFSSRIKKEKEIINPPPFLCNRCGKGRDQGIHVLTIRNNDKFGICYDCASGFSKEGTAR